MLFRSQLERQLAQLRESFPVEMKVNRVISEKNVKAEGGSDKNKLEYPRISKHKRGKCKPIKTKQMRRRQAKISRVRHNYPTPINNEEKNKLHLTLAGRSGDYEVIGLADSGANGSLLSLAEVERMGRVNEITRWKGPTFSSLHDQFNIVGQLLDEICINGQ